MRGGGTPQQGILRLAGLGGEVVGEMAKV
uniref:Uncharacterized protein n=1 Tax=Anguilla anguilla TaxID=7936 RepID=A0A0E9QT25_ANGAN